MPTNTATLFVSAVTDEFKSYRDAAAKWLDGPGMRIETQEKFLPLGRSTLVKLSEYIHLCDAVVHLVGDRTGNRSGGIANPAAVESLLEAHRDFHHALGLSTEAIYALSYTQWEAWLAIYHKKRMVIAVPAEDTARDNLLDDAVQRQAQFDQQRAHLSALANRGHYPEIRFGNSDQLCLGLVPIRDLLLRGARAELGLTNVISLSDYRDGLAGFRRFLSSVNLPFRSPDRRSPYHPDELLRSLETSGDAKGVLLAGAGGVGKTRTTFEVAQLAESQGWRVIYVLPGQPAVTAEKIVEAVLAHGPGMTMVVIEYLDQMQELDLGALRRHLIQTSKQHDIRFGLMANCRPGFLLTNHHERDATFDIVSLVPTTQEAENLSRYVALETAPKALKIIGETELNRLCGHRAIIALLVAQQIEQMAEDSKLRPGEFHAVRSGDLGHWLRRRLADDDLIVRQPDSIWDEAEPPPHLVAATTALACAPDSSVALTAAASAALREIGSSDSCAERVIRVLESVGWLEPEGPWMNVVHDVVADELAEQTLFDLDAIRVPMVSALMEPAFQSPRSLGRLTITLTRVEGATSIPRKSTLRADLSSWFGKNSKRIGETVAAADADIGGYALGAILGGSVFEEIGISEWSNLVNPWLANHDKSFEARHLLYRGLRSHHGPILPELIPIAIEWLERWRSEFQASYVLGPLVRLVPAETDDFKSLFKWSLDWVTRNIEFQEAQFVLHPLLGRSELTGDSAVRAVEVALQWLDSFSEAPEARFVLHPLLDRSELTGDSAVRAVEITLQWLDSFSETPDAKFVLHPLLNRSELTGDGATHAIKFALGWLDKFSEDSEARFVIDPLLRRAELSGDSGNQTIEIAVQWLERFQDLPFCSFVLAPLVRYRELEDDFARRTTELARRWLTHFGGDVIAGFVFVNWCLGKNANSIPEEFKEVALQWARRNREQGGGGPSLILQIAIPGLEPKASEHTKNSALVWVRSHDRHPLIGDVLLALLKYRSSSKGVLDVAIACALDVGWKHHANRVREFFDLALEILPESDPRRDEIEAIVEMEF
ncbi:MAG: hypothetical protein KDN19_14140 [Verrucomicrobiae bacterium]|nr:hypothetical protein [Verrucomicrobiae bacterium]